MALTRDAILGSSKLKTESINVPEWGGEVIVRELTGRERDEFEASCVVIGDDGKARPNLRMTRARLVVASVVDEDGARLFTDGDLDLVAGLSGAALDKVFTVASRLSALSDADVETLAGN